MASVRMQAFMAIEAKLELVRQALDWRTLIVNPREPVGEDQLDAILLAHGGDMIPEGLTGHVELLEAEFSVGMVVCERAGMTPEELLDAGFVAISDALTDPTDMQLSGLVVTVRRGAISPPYIGTAQSGARLLGAQEIEFSFQYMAREGDASTPAP